MPSWLIGAALQVALGLGLVVLFVLVGFGLLWSFRVLCNLSGNSFLTRLR